MSPANMESEFDTILPRSTFTNGTIIPVTLSLVALYTENEKLSLRIIALAFSSLSLCAGALMFYWYVRLGKRTFRHSLVMGLISADMGRSFFEFAYPIVNLSGHEVTAGSPYCEVGGFFTSFFFEASDLMVFIIAIHTALYVFYPKLNSRSDEGGLWRWRHYVIPLWVVIPGLLAGLAFINPIAYVPLVTWCYLPARPLAWRYALAWAPRYFIFLTISVLYVALYFHVRRAYRTIDRNQRENSFSGSELDTDEVHPDESHESPPRPKTSLQVPQPSHLQRKRPSIPPPLFEESEKESRASTSASFNVSPSPTSESAIISSPPPLEITPIKAATLRNMSVTTTLNDALPPSLYNLASTDRDAGQSFSYHRARVERQMRTLFIFPVVYFIMWIPPFINHLYQVITYDSNATTLPPGTFVVTILATIFLPAQGFVNVCVYAIRERPWRRGKRPQSLPANGAGTFGDWHFHCDKNSERRNSALGIQAQIDQAKINHKRMSNPTDAAYTRRDIERGERELARAQIAESRHVRSNWWDEEGIEKV